MNRPKIFTLLLAASIAAPAFAEPRPSEREAPSEDVARVDAPLPDAPSSGADLRQTGKGLVATGSVLGGGGVALLLTCLVLNGQNLASTIGSAWLDQPNQRRPVPNSDAAVYGTLGAGLGLIAISVPIIVSGAKHIGRANRLERLQISPIAAAGTAGLQLGGRF